MKAVLCAILALASIVGVSRARACDTALYLLIDASYSFSDRDWEHTVRAHADALRHPRVAAVVERGAVMIAVGVYADRFRELIPWRTVSSERDLESIAHTLERDAISRPALAVGSGTATGDAVLGALETFGAAACDARIIDVATDGPSGSGTPTTLARDSAERVGVTINVVTVRTVGGDNDPAAWARENLATRETESNTSGFVVETDNSAAWAQAILRKIILELASR